MISVHVLLRGDERECGGDDESRHGLIDGDDYDDGDLNFHLLSLKSFLRDDDGEDYGFIFLKKSDRVCEGPLKRCFSD